MDPALLAAAERIVGFLSIPVTAKVAEAVIGKLAGGAVDRIGGWMRSLKERFKKDPEAAKAAEALDKFEADPAANAVALRDQLAARMAVDPELRDEATELAREVGPRVVVTMRAGQVEVQEGPEFGAVLRGEVTVELTMGSGRHQVGPKFGDIG